MQYLAAVFGRDFFSTIVPYFDIIWLREEMKRDPRSGEIFFIEDCMNRWLVSWLKRADHRLASVSAINALHENKSIKGLHFALDRIITCNICKSLTVDTYKGICYDCWFNVVEIHTANYCNVSPYSKQKYLACRFCRTLTAGFADFIFFTIRGENYVATHCKNAPTSCEFECWFCRRYQSNHDIMYTILYIGDGCWIARDTWRMEWSVMQNSQIMIIICSDCRKYV